MKKQRNHVPHVFGIYEKDAETCLSSGQGSSLVETFWVIHSFLLDKDLDIDDVDINITTRLH